MPSGEEARVAGGLGGREAPAPQAGTAAQFAAGSCGQFEPEAIAAFMDRIGDAIDDIAAAAMHELVDARLAGRGPLARLMSRDMADAVLALGSIALGILANLTANQSTIGIIVIWCSIAAVNLAHSIRRHPS